MADESGGDDTPIVIKKIVQGGGHHGGAWKVAYADFVTAMMAFFLLLWLLNVSTEEQRNAISNYFDPTHPKVSDMTSGAGGVMGGTSLDTQGAMTSSIQNINKPVPTGKTMNAAKATSENKGDSLPNDVQKEGSEIIAAQSAQAAQAAQTAEAAEEQAAQEELREQEQEELQKIQDALDQAMQENPELANLAENLMVDMTPEGLRIQVVDAKGKPMFASGSARMFDKTQTLMKQVAKAIKNAPNEISIRGHTDSIPYGAGATYTNWELSSDRANTSRRFLAENGVAADRLNNVVGKADTEHLLPDDPTNPRNRRISIILLREELTDPEGYKKRAKNLAKKKRAARAPVPKTDGTPLDALPPRPSNVTPSIPVPEANKFKQTDGAIQFP